MAFNKYMHPRNIYRTPPNFQELAGKYPDFGKFVKVNLNGEASIDFHNPEALKALTKTLLKHDFKIDINIPEQHLIPTLTLRLNYILWLEDLIALLPGSLKTKEIVCIDIGTGPCCIYPLLGCRLHPEWKFIATDIKEDVLNWAQENIIRNGMQDRIHLQLVSPGIFVCGILQDGMKATITMANPPFFKDSEEVEDRTSERDPPRSHQTPAFHEKVMDGGEESFFGQLLEESLKLKDQIMIYTTMLGKKKSFLVAKKKLKEYPELSYTTTEFCQGRTFRWGVAWTFLPEINLKKAWNVKHKKTKKLPLTYTVPHLEGKPYTVTIVLEVIKTLLQEIKVEHEVLHETKNSADMWMRSKENTWSHQRRKRREQLRLQRLAGEIHSPSSPTKQPPSPQNGTVTSPSIPSQESPEGRAGIKRKVDETLPSEPLAKQAKWLEDDLGDEASCQYLLYCDLKIRRQGKNIIIKLFSREEFNASREAMHQVLTFLKNRLTQTTTKTIV